MKVCVECKDEILIQYPLYVVNGKEIIGPYCDECAPEDAADE